MIAQVRALLAIFISVSYSSRPPPSLVNILDHESAFGGGDHERRVRVFDIAFDVAGIGEDATPDDFAEFATDPAEEAKARLLDPGWQIAEVVAESKRYPAVGECAIDAEIERALDEDSGEGR